MAADERDQFRPKEQPRVAAPGALLWESDSPESTEFESAIAPSASVAVAPRRRRFRAARFALAFALSALASLLLLMAVALVLSSYYSNRVFPGVRVGSVDVSGMSREEVIARLQSAYAYLGQGEVTVTTPVGVATITYQQVGRGPDVDVMADAAMNMGHTGNPIGDAAFVIRSALDGQPVPVVVRLDPMALATSIRALVGTTAAPPLDAYVTIKNGTYALSPSTSGRGIDEKAISGAIIEQLTQADAPADLQAGGTFVNLDPAVSDEDAQDAIAAAQKMIVDLKLVWSVDLTPNQSPAASPMLAASQTPIPAQTFTINAQTVRGWIVFGTMADGGYGPAVDPALVRAYLAELAPKVAISPVEPSVVTDSTGKPVSLKGGKDGAAIDVGATSQAIEAYLDSLASGGNPGSTIAVVTAPISPSVTLDSLSGLVIIGHWTTVFFPGVSNGNGVNISLPATLLNGQVVAAGQQFSFLDAVGPIDAAHGWEMGGVILDGKSDHTGAIGGGICSASTTMFNAAARAGLQIDERHAHFYYIDRYPVGLDATVYSDGYEVWDLKWTNDTPNPIVIRGYSTKGSTSTVTFELWSLPLNRTVTFAPTPAPRTNVVQPHDSTVYVNTLKPGQQNRAEYPTVGFDTYQIRTVTDANGNVIHQDTWVSHYTKVDGILQIGGTAPASKAPATPPPATPPPATPPPAPTASLATRRRKVRLHRSR